MKRTFFFRLNLLAALVLAVTSLGFAQETKPEPQVLGTIAETKPSPPATASGKIGTVDVTVNYNSPAVKGRKIWGELVPYDKVWRTGANEATIITFGKDVMVEGQKLAAGKYSVYTIPGQNEWTVIFNKATGQWGTEYKEDQDALRVKVKPVAASESSERMTIDVKEKAKNDGVVTINWEKMSVPISVKPASAT